MTKKYETPVPTEKDWEGYTTSLDGDYAYKNFFGKTSTEMLPRFRENPLEGSFDLSCMPEIPFRYYLLGFRDMLSQENLDQENHSYRSDAASTFMRLVFDKLEREPKYILPIMADLLPALELIAHNQIKFEASEDIYGSFAKMYEQIRSLYAERLANSAYTRAREPLSKKVAEEIRAQAFEAIRVLSQIKNIHHDEYAKYSEMEKRSNILISQVQDLILSFIYQYYSPEELGSHWKQDTTSC